MRKMLILSLLIMLSTFSLYAPAERVIKIVTYPAVMPFTEILKAVRQVESSGNDSAYNVKEDAAGPLQIRIVRLNDYNLRTGSNYKPDDRYSYEISKRIFMYYVSRYRPDDILSICRDWNGASKNNLYYHKIIEVL